VASAAAHLWAVEHHPALFDDAIDRVNITLPTGAKASRCDVAISHLLLHRTQGHSRTRACL